jgi:hypothetical protein
MRSGGRDVCIEYVIHHIPKHPCKEYFMRKTATLVLLLVVATVVVYGQAVRIATAYNYPLLPGTATDTVLNALKSIRGCAFDADVDGNGKAEIAVTNYAGAGYVHVFEVVSNDSIQLVWTSPKLTSGGGNSTPRCVLFGDLDNDGRKEVIFQSSANGIYIFEWDGVTGSHNYGTTPSQVIGAGSIEGVTGASFAEYMEVADVDGDKENELIVAYNAATNATDKYYVFSAAGDWATNDPGFSSLNVEYAGRRTELAKYALDGGTPYAMISANLDGTGNKEILIHNYNRKNITIMRVPGANTYVLADSTSGKQNAYLGQDIDDVALFSGLAYDIDGDGREEIYLPTYPGLNPSGAYPHAGWVHMISYNTGESTSIIDTSKNVALLNFSAFTGSSLFGFGYGDIDGNGKKNIYFSGGYGANVVTAEFQGGDKRNAANWKLSLVYKGDSTIYTAIRYRDSLGVKDTTRTIDPSFASKIWARNTDFDKDGKEDMILPYQALIDTIAISRLTWNASQSKFDTVTSSQTNPKRWGFRILEKGSATGVDVRDLTVVMPEDYVLEQNYPNPFNPTTNIRFSLPVSNKISLTVFDVLGKEVKTLVNGEDLGKGAHAVAWDGTNNANMPVASGTYIYTLKYGNFSKSQKMMLVK